MKSTLSRERSFWQKNGGDLAMLVDVGLFPGIDHLPWIFVRSRGFPASATSSRIPPPAPPRQAEKFYYSVPGEVIMNIAPGKPIVLPPPPAQPAPQQNR